MIYSQFALFMLRVFNMAQRVALTPEPPLIDYTNHDNRLDPVLGLDGNVRVIIDEGRREHDLSGVSYLGVEDEHRDQDGQIDSRTRMRRILGDVQIGALFPIHRKKKGSESCGEIWEQYGMHRTEVALRTIEEINNDSSILPNVRLGIDIRDDCWTERTAMEETIEFIRESIGSGPETTCGDGKSDGAANKTTSNLLLAAVVGPGNSDMSIATHNLLQVFRIPQVGYSATTADLSDKSDFKYFMRLVPSDLYQAQALIDIAVHFQWTYIAVIYSNGNYGEKGYEQMQAHIERAANLCVAYTEKIDSLAPAQRFDELLNSILKLDPRPRVAICFCEGDTMRRIFEATKRRRTSPHQNNTDSDIQWIGSESWSDRRDVVQGYEDVATGGISLRIYSPKVKTFDNYFWKLKPSTNSHNPWFVDFWEERFNCSLVDRTRLVYSKRCTGNEDLSNGYLQDPKLSQVINSIYTVAYGLDAMYRNVCLGYTSRGLCPAMRALNGTKLLDYMLNVRFNDSHGQEISFDRNGDPPARYDVLSFQGTNYVLAGEWRSIISVNENGTTVYKHNLTVHADKWLWYDGTYAKDAILASICTLPCQPGWVKKIQATKCCWTCVRCLDNEYIADEATCRNCTLGDWPTDNRSSCYKLEIEYLRSGSPEAIVVMVLSCIGILATFYTTAIFARFNSTPVVKATTRELSYIILVGFFLCYATTFVIVIQPNTATCYILRILPGFAFAMIYGALLTKTNRIARILAGSKKRILTKKPRFLTTRSQVVITWILVSVELIIITAILIYEPAKADYDYSFPRRVLLVCQASTLSFLAPFGFDFFLITLCTLYAVKTRNLPENFNEAKFIGFTMYTTCIIWLAFITIYFGSNNKGITMCLSFTLSASVALVLLFFPKLYIILFQPHKNVRSSYATTKVIRCHFGTSQSSTISHSPHDSHRYKPRTSSSGPKTTSTSRPSSKISTRSEIPISDSGSRFKKTFMRDSVHVQIPQTGAGGGSTIGGQLTKEGQQTSSKDPSAPPDDSASSGARQFRSSVYFQNELSVIEESLMSHDDSLQSQSHLASSGPGSGDQQSQPQPQVLYPTLVSGAGPPPPSTKSELCQTDSEIFEDFIKTWLLEKQRRESGEPEELPNVRKRSLSMIMRTPSFRRKSADTSVAEGGSLNAEEMEEKHYEFKRTFTEYRKGSKRIRRTDGSRLKLPRQSIVQETLAEDGVAEQLAALISRRQSWSTEANRDRGTGSTSPTGEAPFMMRVNALAPIDAVISSSVEEFKRKNTLKKKNRRQFGSISGPSAAGSSSCLTADAEAADSAEGSESESSQRHQHQPRRSVNANTPFGDIMAQTFGGAFQTFMGTAVPVDEKEDFYITTEAIEEVEEEEECRPKPTQPKMNRQASLIGHTLEYSFDALVLPGAGEYMAPQQDAGDSNGLIVGGQPTGSASSSKFDRKGSLFARLGNSIRKKLRRFSGDAAAKVFEEQFRHSEIIQNARRSSAGRSRQNSVSETSETALAEDLAAAAALVDVPENAIIGDTESPFGSPARRPLHHSQTHRRSRRNRNSYSAAGGESMETDSGISRQFEKTISFDDDTDTSKRSSSDKSKRSSYKRSRTVSAAMTTSASGLPNLVTTTIATTAVDAAPSQGAASSSMDAGFVDAQTAVNELEVLLQSQGLEPVEFSRSTLV